MHGILQPLSGNIVIEVKVYAEHDHENGNHNLLESRIVRTAGIQDREASGAGGSECNAQCIEQGHVPQQKNDNFHYGQPDIQFVQCQCRRFYLRNQLGNRRAGAFRLHQEHLTSAGQRQKRNHKYNNAHAADPVGKAAPEKNAVRYGFHIRQYAGSGGRETGGRLENSIYKARDGA